MTRKQKAEFLMVIATPSPVVARRWKNTVRNICAVHFASDFEKAHQQVKEWKPSVILFDLTLPPVEGVERFSILLKASSASRLIAFSEKPTEKEAVQSLRAGARGYAHRDLDPVLLKKAVEVVRKGELWISRNTIPHLVQELTEISGKEEAMTVPRLMTRRVELGRLTSREQEIAFLIGNGSSNKEIARFLKISESTVKAHLSSIFHKLGLLDRLSLALFVAQHVRSAEQHRQVTSES